MRKIVSFFGEDTDVFRMLNKKAKEYALCQGYEYKFVIQKPFDKNSVIEELRQADAGIIDIEEYGEEIFSQIKDTCKILTRFGVGYDKVDLEAASKNGIAIARTPGANTIGVAEMSLMLILASHRQLKQNMELVQQGNWEKNVINEVYGSTVGILGFGNIGQALAKMLKGLECKIVAYDPYASAETFTKQGVSSVSIDELFAISDSISVHMPITEDTRNLIDATMLSKMKPNAVIVNTARGHIINEKDLYTALKNKVIAGAALDVFGTEPLPITSPLLELDNIILTPHVSSQTEESLWKIYKMAIDVTIEFFEKGHSEYILNKNYSSIV